MSVFFLKPVPLTAKSFFNLDADLKESPAELPEKNGSYYEICCVQAATDTIFKVIVLFSIAKVIVVYQNQDLCN